MTEQKKTHRRSTPKEALHALEQAYEYYAHQPLPTEARNHYSDVYTNLSVVA